MKKIFALLIIIVCSLPLLAQNSTCPAGTYTQLSSRDTTGFIHGIECVKISTGELVLPLLGSINGSTLVTPFASLQTAVTATCNGTVPGVIIAPANYAATITATVPIPSHCTIYWNNAVLTAKAVLNNNMLQLTTASDVHFIGPLTLDGNQANQTAGAFASCLGLNTNSNDNEFTGITCLNPMDSGIVFANGSSRNKCINCKVTGAGGTGININAQGNGIYVVTNANDNWFINSYVSGSQGQANITVDGSQRVHFIGGRSTAALYKGILAENAANYLEISNFDVDANGVGSPTPTSAAGILMQTGGSQPDQCKLSNINAQGNMNTGVEVQTNYCTLSDITTDGTLDAGIPGSGFGFFYSGSYATISNVRARQNARNGAAIFSANHITGSNFVLTDNGTLLANTYDGLRVDNSTHIIITGIRSGNTIATGQRNGIGETGTSSLNQYFSADLTNNQTGASALNAGSVLLGEFKHVRAAGCATAAAAGAVCTTAINWGTAFGSTSYTAVCYGELVTSGVPLPGDLSAKAVGSVTFRTVAATAVAAQFTTIDCTAWLYQ